MVEFETRTPDQLVQAATVSSAALLVIQEPGGPVVSVPASRAIEQLARHSFGVTPLAGIGPHAVVAGHFSRELVIAAEAQATIVVPADAPIGAVVIARCLGAAIAVAAAAGATVENWQGHSHSAAALAPIVLTCVTNISGANARWMLDGATA